MTRQQQIDEFRHAVSGAWLDVLYRRPDGPDLSIAIRLALTRVDQAAAKFYDQVIESNKQGAQNGAAQPQKATTK